jgi:sulfotransferase family protein
MSQTLEPQTGNLGSTVALPDRPGTRTAKKLAPENAKQAAKSVLRQFGVLTSSRRRLPDVLLVGAKRSGSTSLHNYLLQHPQVAPLFPRAAHVKGAHYFDRNAAKPLSWYRSFGPIERQGRKRITVDGSPYYFIHPSAPYQAAATLPSAKVVVLLREPATRALSQYWDEVKLGRETLSFGDALEAEPERLAGEVERILADPGYYSEAHEHLSYALWGRYAEHLERWFEAFGRERVLVVRSEDMFADPGTTFRQVTDFIGIDPAEPPAYSQFNSATRHDDLEPVLASLRGSFAEPNKQLAELLDTDVWWS